MIAFRVDTQCGMGHFMRMKWLAVALEGRGAKTVFLIDENAAVGEFMAPLQAKIVWVPKFQNCREDAEFCLSYLDAQAMNIQWVVLDGYGFDVTWEDEARQHGVQLMSMDDLGREHHADLVVDMKWAGKDTHSRYENLVAPGTDCLLGPEFAILAPEYQENESLEQRPDTITFSLGGGGDWTQLTEVIEQLFLCGEQTCNILAVIGPKALNTEKLRQLENQFDNLVLVDAPKSLASIYRKTGLFVGALGTSLYELAVTKTPALTFSLAVNQHNEIENLQDLGHYYHVPDLLDYPVSNVYKLIITLFEHRSTIAAQRRHPSVHVDGLGQERIADTLLGTPVKQRKQLQPESSNAVEVVSELSDSLHVRKVTNNDVNGYLRARNRSENMWRMTITDTIKEVDHYAWWFNNNRHSYVLEKDNKPLIYVWHQVYRDNQQDYLFGGWFAASNDVNFVHAQLILNWQLEYCAAQHPEAVWLAVINKDNKFVNLLNQKEGFVALTPESQEFSVTQRLFPQASEDEFNYVAKFPASRA
ncbi:PseG/SpsG family protein [Pseudoalteromonas luteoviolacea]|uniref:Spore coat polysaccharide biosynthesis protein, putative glycosyltransferase n=1 Tax=Pseudoalteromonas luteoviolacea (strain 2ta16) TaxID=1353533 RepID=V4GZ37_PSEL2|nr:Spore coat polysaccharide biosynthesis protein glycosyltransferase [Pseudoalteromonas luteoviolacea]ESP90431.1 Spore coat polysaccharide biosynthesis protein, putative glycosyltransferase [Pseudoalteromonas luteoviolacea 2ta16]KZN42001.1 hypothetical protein N483_15120 [Pseudoalteromonas luteoviolacea NCIMB 1944]